MLKRGSCELFEPRPNHLIPTRARRGRRLASRFVMLLSPRRARYPLPEQRACCSLSPPWPDQGPRQSHFKQARCSPRGARLARPTRARTFSYRSCIAATRRPTPSSTTQRAATSPTLSSSSSLSDALFLGNLSTSSPTALFSGKVLPPCVLVAPPSGFPRRPARTRTRSPRHRTVPLVDRSSRSFSCPTSSHTSCPAASFSAKALPPCMLVAPPPCVLTAPPSRSAPMFPRTRTRSPEKVPLGSRSLASSWPTSSRRAPTSSYRLSPRLVSSRLGSIAFKPGPDRTQACAHHDRHLVKSRPRTPSSFASSLRLSLARLAPDVAAAAARRDGGPSCSACYASPRLARIHS